MPHSNLKGIHKAVKAVIENLGLPMQTDAQCRSDYVVLLRYTQEVHTMTIASKRKIAFTLDAAMPDCALDHGINVSALVGTALQNALAEARRHKWFIENASAFAAQAGWQEHNGHPLSDIIASPGGASWTT